MYNNSFLMLGLIESSKTCFGLDTAKMLEIVHLDPNFIDHFSYEVDIDTLDAFFSSCMHYSRDNFLGLKLGKQFELHHLGIVGHAMHVAPNMYDIALLIKHFIPYFFKFIQVDTQEEGDFFKLSMYISSSWTKLNTPSVNILHQYLVSVLCKTMQLLCGKEVVPHQVRMHVEDPASEDKATYQSFLDTENILFTEDQQIVLTYKKVDIFTFRINGEKSLFETFKKYSYDILEDSSSYYNKIRAILFSYFYYGSVKEERVARDLGMAKRTLQRKLKLGNVSYREIVNEIRKEVAIGYLEGYIMSVRDIASRLGYTEVSALSKAFKFWTGGLSPQQYRTAHYKKLRGF